MRIYNTFWAAKACGVKMSMINKWAKLGILTPIQGNTLGVKIIYAEGGKVSLDVAPGNKMKPGEEGLYLNPRGTFFDADKVDEIAHYFRRTKESIK